MKKAPGDITILHMCIKYYDHMMHDSWFQIEDGGNFTLLVNKQKRHVIL